MNSKMTTKSQLSTTEPKNQKPKQTKQITRTGTESQKWITWRVISREGEGGEWGKRYRNKKHNW